MKRRGFFSALTGAAVAGTAVAEPLELPSELVYNGFRVQWTGWKESAYETAKIGQWTARRLDGDLLYHAGNPWGSEGIYSSFPGAVNYFHTSQILNICFTQEQRELVMSHEGNYWSRDEKVLLAGQRQSLKLLKKFIDENC